MRHRSELSRTLPLGAALALGLLVGAVQWLPTLARTLDSCIAQPQAAEIIVADDGSSDASTALVERYAAHDARVSLLPMPATDANHLSIELGAGLMLLVGWRTRWAAWLLVEQMYTNSGRVNSPPA